MSRVEQETSDRGDMLRWRGLRLDVEPCVYGTVVLMTVLVVCPRRRHR